jgi:hypothetical protein
MATCADTSALEAMIRKEPARRLRYMGMELRMAVLSVFD